MKFGFSYMRVDKNQQQQALVQGQYNFGSSDYAGDSYLNFLLGLADQFTQLQQLRTASLAEQHLLLLWHGQLASDAAPDPEHRGAL